MSITFYYAPKTSSARVHWALEELGVPYEAVRVDLAAGEQRTPAFLAINPNGKVAALVDDGAPMLEPDAPELRAPASDRSDAEPLLACPGSTTRLLR